MADELPIRIVVADDHPVVRGGLVALLRTIAGLDVVGEVADGDSALEAVSEYEPDVVLMDVRMPGMDGIEATRRIRAVAPDCRVLMLTMFDDDATLFTAMKAGAHGYLLKEAEPDDIVRAVRSVVAGEAVFGPGVASRVLGYPTPTASHPIDYCLWVVVAGGCVVTLAFGAIDRGVSGAVGSIVLIAMMAHGWRVLERDDEPDRIAGLWLAWAGLIAIVVGILAVSYSPTGDWRLTVAVLPFGVVGLGMAIGIRRPGLADVRALVVSTVVLAVVALSYLSAFIGTVAFLEVVGIDEVPPWAFAILGLVLAAGFHPLRVVLRGLIDELLFGDRPDPLVAAAAVADRIADDPLLTLRAVRKALVLRTRASPPTAMNSPAPARP